MSLTAILTGCIVTSNGDMSVSVSSGVALFEDNYTPVQAAVVNIPASYAEGQQVRWDTIVVYNDGSVGDIRGDGGDVSGVWQALAQVFVPGNIPALNPLGITDRRSVITIDGSSRTGSLGTLYANNVFATTVTATGSTSEQWDYVPIDGSATLSSASGSDDVDAPAYLAGVRGSVVGSSLTKAANYLGGVIGRLAVLGSRITSKPVGAVLGPIAPGVTEADGSFVAFDDYGDTPAISGAAFKVRKLNNQPGSGFYYGVDLQDAAHDDVPAVSYLIAPIRFGSDVVLFSGSEMPTDGSTGAGFAGPMSIYLDVYGKSMYLNGGTLQSPVWKLVTIAA